MKQVYKSGSCRIQSGIKIIPESVEFFCILGSYACVICDDEILIVSCYGLCGPIKRPVDDDFSIYDDKLVVHEIAGLVCPHWNT